MPAHMSVILAVSTLARRGLADLPTCFLVPLALLAGQLALCLLLLTCARALLCGRAVGVFIGTGSRAMPCLVAIGAPDRFLVVSVVVVDVSH